MVNYPTSLDTDGTLWVVTDSVTDVLAKHHNDLKDAVIAIETKVGITGSEAFVLTTGDTMTGPLTMTGSTVLIDLNPSGTGSANIIDITPTAAISGGATWIGLNMSGESLDPSGSDSYVTGMQLQLANVSMSNTPLVTGLYVNIPSAFSNLSMAAYFGGDGKVVKICDKDYALFVDAGDAMFDGNLLMSGTGTSDKRLTVPYLTAAPSTLTNGSIWMESDGLHIYYNNAEKLVAGV